MTVRFESSPRVGDTTDSHWIVRRIGRIPLSPLRITLIYVVFGYLGLFVSDVLFVLYLSDPILTQVQTLTGGTEILLTAGLIFVLTSRRESQVRESRQRLRHQREELSVLHRVLRHNIRNDVNVMVGYARMLREELVTEETSEYCDRILETAERMDGYTERAKQIRHVTESDGGIKHHDLSEVISRVTASNPRVRTDATLSVSVPDDAVVEANHMLEHALGEVLENAVEHGGEGETTVEVRVREAAQGRWEIRVADDGPGIPEFEIEALRQYEEDPLVHLSGMGLWFVYWTVDRSGGELRIDTGVDGTMVCFVLPAAE